jgi:hypothetical protein
VLIEPDAAISALSYLRAVQAGYVEAAREFAGTEPRMPELLVDVAERVVAPCTALAGPDAADGIARATRSQWGLPRSAARIGQARIVGVTRRGAEPQRHQRPRAEDAAFSVSLTTRS